MRLSILIALLCMSCSVAVQAQLPEPLAQALRRVRIAEADVAYWVAPAEGGAPIHAHNAHKSLNPASVMKLFTTLAALERLGPAWSWRTDALLRGPLVDGVLEGDLILRGTGDPMLTWERFGQFLRDLRARGLMEIRGDLVLDRSLFAAQPVDISFDDQPQRAYNAAPDALLVEFKALQLRLVPQPASGSVRVELLTPFAPLEISGRLKLTNGPCGDWRAALRYELQTNSNGLRLHLPGQYSTQCGERSLYLAVHDNGKLATGIFRQMWQELGGRWSGNAREGIAPVEATLFASWQSPALAEAVRSINKFSNNVMARQLYLSLGAQRGNLPVSPVDGEAVLREWLASRGLSVPELVLENGSGLSRNERAAAESLGRLLQQAWRSPRMPEFVSSLPIAGVDGTAKRRFEFSSVAGRAYLKTGSLDDVMSVAGYVQDVAGRWQTVVFLIHGERAAAGEVAQILAVELAASPR